MLVEADFGIFELDLGEEPFFLMVIKDGSLHVTEGVEGFCIQSLHCHFFLAAGSIKRYNLSEYPAQSNSYLLLHFVHNMVSFGSTAFLHFRHVTSGDILRLTLEVFGAFADIVLFVSSGIY